MAKSKTQDRKRSKYRVGQVVRCDLHEMYAIVTGFDDGRYHLNGGGIEYKVMPALLRPLTAREKGKD